MVWISSCWNTLENVSELINIDLFSDRGAENVIGEDEARRVTEDAVDPGIAAAEDAVEAVTGTEDAPGSVPFLMFVFSSRV